MLVTLWAALTLNFFIPRLMPGSAYLSVIAQFHGHINPAALQALKVEFGGGHINLFTAYLHYLKNTATGQFGVSASVALNVPVMTLVGRSIPYTLGLVGVSTILGFVLGTVIGAVAAWRRGGAMDNILPPTFVVISAFPYFWVALLIQYIFALTLNWFPAIQGYDAINLTPGFSFAFIWSVLDHAFLPAFTIVITAIGGWILTMRNNMITVVAEDYVKMARAKGLKSNRIMWQYAGRNALLPNLQGFAMSLGFVVSGAILVENVFSYPGVGLLLFQAVTSNDYPVMQALFLLITLAVLLAVFAADIATAVLDPRTRNNR